MDKDIKSNTATNQPDAQPPLADEAQRRETSSCLQVADGLRAHLESIAIDKIVGLHPSLSDAEGMCDVLYDILSGTGQPLSEVNAVLQPVTVLRIKGKYLCVSSPGDYIAMRLILPQDRHVLAVVLDSRDTCAIDQQLRENADLQTVIAISRVARLGPRRMIGDLAGRLPTWAKKILGGGRASLSAMCGNLGISVNTIKKMAMPTRDDASPERYDIQTPVGRRNEWRRRRNGTES